MPDAIPAQHTTRAHGPAYGWMNSQAEGQVYIPASSLVSSLIDSQAPSQAHDQTRNPSGKLMHDGGRGGDGAPRIGSAPSCQAMLHHQLLEEYRPEGVYEEYLVSQLAHHLAVVEEQKAARQAAIRAGVAIFCDFTGHPCPTADATAHGVAPFAVADEVVVGAMTSMAVGRLDLGIERSGKQIQQITATLAHLQQARWAAASGRGGPRGGEGRAEERLTETVAQEAVTCETATQQPISSPPVVPTSAAARLAEAPQQDHGDWHGDWIDFTGEAECEQAFRSWLRTAGLACPQCGSRLPPLELARRRVLQCRSCGRQRGLRHGTLLANANISFRAFFAAVRQLAKDPQISLAALQLETGLSRRTIRRLRSRILEELGDPARGRELLMACGWRPHGDHG